MKERGTGAVRILALLLVIGLAAGGVCLYLQDRQELTADSERIQAQNESVLSKLSALIPEESDGQVSTVREDDPDRQSENLSLPMLEVDGFSCVGVLTLEKQRLTWAVVDEDSDTADCFLPAVESGYPADGDLIIRGFDHEAQFAAIQKTEIGDRVSFEDINGITYHYIVADKAKLEMEQVRRTLSGQNTGLVVSGETMRATDEIDLQLYYEIGDKYRFVVDCAAVSAED